MVESAPVLRILLFLALTVRPAAAGPAFDSLQRAAASGSAAARSSDPSTGRALASQSLDGGAGLVMPAYAPQALPSAKLAPKPQRHSPPSPPPLNGRRDAVNESNDGWGMLATAGVWVGIGMFAIANPWAAVAWGAVNAAMGASLLLRRSGEQPRARKAGGLLLLALGATAIAAPPAGALAFVGVGAVVGVMGLFKLAKGLFGGKS